MRIHTQTPPNQSTLDESECHGAFCMTEKRYYENLRNFTAYNARWSMPSASSGGILNMWYSFNHGPIHFVSLNTETDFPGAGEENTGDSGDKRLPAGHFGPDGAYLRWLEADLKQASTLAQRTSRPWIVAGGHRPYHEIESTVGPLFRQYGVDMYFCGHTHSYVRTFPGTSSQDVETWHARNHYKDANATTTVVVGGTGCDEMPYIGEASSSSSSSSKGVAPPTLRGGHGPGSLEAATAAGFTAPAVATAELAFGILTVANASALHWQLHGSVTGDILDDLWLTKSSS